MGLTTTDILSPVSSGNTDVDLHKASDSIHTTSFMTYDPKQKNPHRTFHIRMPFSQHRTCPTIPHSTLYGTPHSITFSKAQKPSPPHSTPQTPSHRTAFHMTQWTSCSQDSSIHTRPAIHIYHKSFLLNMAHNSALHAPYFHSQCHTKLNHVWSSLHRTYSVMPCTSSLFYSKKIPAPFHRVQQDFLKQSDCLCLVKSMNFKLAVQSFPTLCKTRQTFVCAYDRLYVHSCTALDYKWRIVL